MEGLKEKASLYDHFEGLTTDSYLAIQDTLQVRSDRKKGFFNPLLMRKHDFWTCPVVFKWSKMGRVKKKHLCMTI